MARLRGLLSRLPKRPQPFRKGSLLRELPLLVVVALVVSIVIKAFLIQAFYIPSGSMQKTLELNDRVIVNKVSGYFGEFKRGDIVVFRDPGGWLPDYYDDDESQGWRERVRGALVLVGLLPDPADKDLIKRIIGVGGDAVTCCDDKGRVTVNGFPLEEKSYLFPGNKPSYMEFSITVPEGRVWVMGDHRDASEDSRFHQDDPRGGMVPVDNILGRASAIIWPFDRAKFLSRPDIFANIPDPKK